MNARDYKQTAAKMGDVSPHTGLPVGQNAHSFQTTAYASDPGEAFAVLGVDTVRTVEPGQTINVVVDWGNDPDGLGFTTIDTDDPDYCNAASTFFPDPGAILYNRVSIAGSVDTGGANCWPVVDSPVITSTRQVSVPTTPGTYDLVVEVVGGNSLDVYDTRTVTITVDDDAPDDGGGGGGGNGPTDPDPDPDPVDCLIEDPFGDGCVIESPGGVTTGFAALILLLVLLLAVSVLS